MIQIIKNILYALFNSNYVNDPDDVIEENGIKILNVSETQADSKTKFKLFR